MYIINFIIYIKLFYQSSQVDNNTKMSGMKSLRTDDIIGASPRVRHMPKNLLR